MTPTALLLLLLAHHSWSVLHVTAPLTHKALIGSTTLLPCTFTVDSPPIKPQFLAILWFYGEKELAQYNSHGGHAEPGTSISEQEVRRGNASLTIHNVTISNQGTYKCLVIYTPNKEEKEIQLNVQALPLVSLVKRFLLKNKNNRLLCLISNFYPMDIRVTWFVNGQQLDGGELGDFQTDANGKYRVNSSITISALQNQDHPTIVCQVEHVTLQDPIQDVYTVHYGAEPKVRLFSSHDHGEEIFVCEMKEFYPDGVEVYWFLDGKRMEPSTRNDAAYNKWDHFRIPENKKRPKDISCMVEHETMGGPLVTTLTVRDEQEPGISSLAVAVPLTIFITLCLISASLAFLIFKKKYFQRFQLSTIHKIGDWSNNSDGKVTMYCTATNCPQEIQVTWSVTEDGGKTVTVSNYQSDGEKGHLLNDNYKVRTDQSQTDGLYNAITSLNFTPAVSKHRDMKAVCIFHCGGKTKEKCLAWSFNTLKPRLTASMKMTLGDSGDVLCSVTLEKFYPRNIQIKWSCGVGNYQELETLNERFHSDSDNMFTCESECRVSGHLFQDPGFKVRVMWEHQSMNRPEIQKLSAEDLPWRPVMGDITVPSLIHGREASFQCVIRGYFPKNLEVTWLRKEAGKSELYVVSSGDRYKIPVMEVTQQRDKTFISTATLVVSMSAITEEGSEFVCRVNHPSLKKHLEKMTGGLTVKGKPVVRKVLQDGGSIILEVDGFYTPDLLVTWERADKEDGPYKKTEDHIVNKMTQSEDGSYSLTSTYEAMRRSDLVNTSDKYFRVKVQHESLKTPEVMIFLRQTRKFYMILNSGPKELEQIEKKSVKKSASSKDTESKALSPSSEHTMWPADSPEQP